MIHRNKQRYGGVGRPRKRRKVTKKVPQMPVNLLMATLKRKKQDDMKVGLPGSSS